jgi:hypothetical protein
MATFDVHLERAGAPTSHKTESLDAHDIAEAWELARTKYYVPLDDPNCTDFQIVRIEAQPIEGELRMPLMALPLFADSSVASRVVKTGPVQGSPGFVAKQGVSESEQKAHAMATGEKQILSTEEE